MCHTLKADVAAGLDVVANTLGCSSPAVLAQIEFCADVALGHTEAAMKVVEAAVGYQCVSWKLSTPFNLYETSL